MRPLLLRPPVLWIPRVRLFSGSLPLVTSAKSLISMNRRPGEVGRNFLVGMLVHSLEDLDGVAGLQLHNGSLVTGLGAQELTAALRLGLRVRGVHAHDGDTRVGQLHRLADLL